MEKNENVQDVEAQEVETGKARYAELPGMLFEEINGTQMFNADNFLKITKSDKTVADYLKDEKVVVAKYCELLKTKKKHITMKLEGEPTMVHGALAMSFAAWLVPELHIYFFERMHELFMDGFSCSDRYIGMATRRLPKQENAPKQA